MTYFVIGVFLVLLGGIFIYMMKSSQGTFAALALTREYTAKELRDIYDSVAKEVGKGTFKEMVEIKGRIVCDSPLTGEMSKEKCVYFKNEIVRDIEESYYEQDAEDNNKKVLKTRKITETICSKERQADFYIQDETGRTKVNPENADMTNGLSKAIDRYEPAAAVSYNEGLMNWGGFSFRMSSEYHHQQEGRKVLGYKFTEYVFPMDKNIFILGEATDSMGELTIARPVSGATTDFIISTKSAEELKASAKGSIATFKVLSIVSFAAGVALMIMGLIKGLK